MDSKTVHNGDTRQMLADDRLKVLRKMVRVKGHDLHVKAVSAPDQPGAPLPTLIFLHEGLGCIEFWRDFPERLVRATGLNALVFDRQGYGRSSPVAEPRLKDYLHREALEELPALLETLSIDRVLPVGHSDGGTIALLYASSFPGRVTAAVTIAAHVFVDPVTLKGIRETVDRYRSGDLKRRLARYHGEKTDWVFRSWADTWLSDRFSDWNIEACLPAIHCPVLVIQGENDEYGDREQVIAITEGIGDNAVSRIIQDCGHAPHLEAHGGTFAAIDRFIRDQLDLSSASASIER